jgi:hypothetical protein
VTYLNIHTRPLHPHTDKPGRPWKRKRRTTWYKKNLRKKDWSKSQSTVEPTAQDLKVWQEVLVQYSEAFDDICSAFYAGYYQDDYFVPKSWAGKIVYDKIKVLGDGFPPPRDLEKADIENTLKYVWYRSVARYNQRKPSNVPFRNYLFRMSLFELQIWRKSMKPLYIPFDDQVFVLPPEEELIDLRWLLYGRGDCFGLNPYERILLFSRYIEEMTYRDISKRLDCSEPKTRSDYQKLENKLREQLTAAA